MDMDQLSGPLAGVIQDIKDKWRELEQQEPWIQGIVAAHVLVFVLALVTRKKVLPQGTIFFTAMTIVYYAEKLNKLGHKHWRQFARQDYFDKHGVFFSTLISGPLLFFMFIVLINYMVACFNAMVEAKKRELAWKAKQQAKAKADAKALGSPRASPRGKKNN